MAETQVETQIASEPVFTGRLIRVRRDTVRLPGGREAVREVVAHPGAVAVVPIVRPGVVQLVRQFRYAAGETLLEIPAGTLDPGETPEECARRECVEEIGRRPGRLVGLADFYVAPGYSDELIRCFLAEDLTEESGQADEDEAIELVELPLTDALARIADGSIRDAKTICGLLLALRKERER